MTREQRDYFQKAARQNDAIAETKLGIVYFQGQGVQASIYG